MLIEAIQTLFDYNIWANGQVFTQAVALSSTSPESGKNVPYRVIHETLFHLVYAQHLWLTRCQNAAPPTNVKIEMFPTVQELRLYWENVEQETSTFIQTLDANALQHVIRYTNLQGQPNAYPLWQALYHMLNHAAQHRSEVAVFLTEAGYSPDMLDFLHYLDVRDDTTVHA